jgi:hypothetical protein
LASRGKWKQRLLQIAAGMAACGFIFGPKLLVHFDNSPTGILRASWLFVGGAVLFIVGTAISAFFSSPVPGRRPPKLSPPAVGLILIVIAGFLAWGLAWPLALDTRDLLSKSVADFVVRGRLQRVQITGGKSSSQNFYLEGVTRRLSSRDVLWDVKPGQPYQIVALPSSEVVLAVQHLDAQPETVGHPWPRGICGPQLSQAKTWALVCGAPLAELNAEPCLCLTGSQPPVPSAARSALESSWDVRNRDDALKTLVWLRDEGHHAGFSKIAAQLQGPAWGVWLLHVNALTNVTQSRRVALADRTAKSLGSHGIEAWDLVRLIWVAGRCQAAGYLSEVEAWDWILDAARRLQRAYGSWSQMQAAYLAGREYWQPWEPDQPSLEAISKALLRQDNAASPFNHLSWHQDLGMTALRPSGGE